MTTNYSPDESSSLEQQTFFGDNSRLTTDYGRQRLYEMRHSLGRDSGEQTFQGFQLDERPSARPLSVLTPNQNRMVVSDSRNEPNFTGDTRIMQPVNNTQERSQFNTAPTGGSVPNIGLPLSSTGRSRIPNIQNTHMGSPIIRNSVPQQQMGWNRSMIGNPAIRNRNLEAQYGVPRPVTDNVNPELRSRDYDAQYSLPRPLTNVENRGSEINNLTSERLESRFQDLRLPRSGSQTNLKTPNTQINDNAEEVVNVRQSNNVQPNGLREAGLLAGNRSETIQNQGNIANEQTDNRHLESNIQMDNGRDANVHYGQYFYRRIDTEAKIYYGRLRKAVESLMNCIENVNDAIESNLIDQLNGLKIELEGKLEIVKDLKDKLEPLVSHLENNEMADYLFVIIMEIPTWLGWINRTKVIIKEDEQSDIAQALKQIASAGNNRYKEKPVNMGTSEFPKFDGKINYYHWWARWSHLAKISKLNEENLEVKLKDSLVDDAEVLMGKTLMSTGNYKQLCEKLDSVYNKPIQRVQEISDDFFGTGNKKKTSTQYEARVLVTEVEDVLLRIDNEKLTTESLILNSILTKLPDVLKRNLQIELSRNTPDFHLTMQKFKEAFDTVTNRIDKKDEEKEVIIYNNFTTNESTKNNDVENKDKEQFCNIHWKYEKECDLKTPIEVRDYLITNYRCIRCGEPKNRHREECKWMKYPCPKHKEFKFFHLARTCEGDNYKHPGCQFQCNNR